MLSLVRDSTLILHIIDYDKVGRNRLIPEYTFMDPRGIGLWDMDHDEAVSTTCFIKLFIISWFSNFINCILCRVYMVM
jgi:hypothetical protein